MADDVSAVVSTCAAPVVYIIEDDDDDMPSKDVGAAVGSRVESDQECARQLHDQLNGRSGIEEVRVDTAPASSRADEILASKFQREEDCRRRRAVVAEMSVLALPVLRSTSAVELVPGPLPADLVSRIAPLYDVCGSREEPVIHIKDADGAQGRLLAGRVLEALARAGQKPPTSRRGGRAGVVAEAHGRKRSRTPWRTGLRVLHGFADQISALLRQDPELKTAVPALRELGSRQGRGWNDTEVLVSSPGYKLARHHDAQPPGSLLFVFCAGLSGRSLAWPGGHRSERMLESGDVLIFDGTATAHAVPDVLEHTSPFGDCPWLGKRRLAVLVRQAPPP